MQVPEYAVGSADATLSDDTAEAMPSGSGAVIRCGSKGTLNGYRLLTGAAVAMAISAGVLFLVWPTPSAPVPSDEGLAAGAPAGKWTAPASGWSSAPLATEKVVLFSRHGIRVPYAPGDGFSLDGFSTDQRDWPSVDPPDERWGALVNTSAALTAHGARVLRAHGAYLRSETWQTVLGGAIGPTACSQVTAYADPDEHTHRDRETVRHFMSGMLPECISATSDETSGGLINVGRELRPIFNSGENSHFATGSVPDGCPGMPSREVIDAGITGGSIDKLTAARAELVDAMSDAVGCCSSSMCARADLPPLPPPGVIHTGATRSCRTGDCGLSVTVPQGGAFHTGRPITVSFTGATDEEDWIGIYHKGHTPGDDDSHDWSYHGSAHGSGSVEMSGEEAGEYFIVLLCCDGYSELTERLPVRARKRVGWLFEPFSHSLIAYSTLNTISLSRQARDKHRKLTQTDPFASKGHRCRGSCPCRLDRCMHSHRHLQP
jgi:hypothetical protein